MKIKFKKMNALKKKQNQNYTKTNKQINKNLTLKNCNCKSRPIILRKKNWNQKWKKLWELPAV